MRYLRYGRNVTHIVHGLKSAVNGCYVVLMKCGTDDVYGIQGMYGIDNMWYG